MKARKRPVFQNDMSRESERIQNGQRKGSSLDNSFIHSFTPQLFTGSLLCAKCEAHHYEDEARKADVITKSLLCRWKGHRHYPESHGEPREALTMRPHDWTCVLAAV